ncbi:MAG: FAD-dependent oxidoreductase [Pirellulales bacterium]|nr:FAD-dependent oxidoreductase [Pirellulales bacterium]
MRLRHSYRFLLVTVLLLMFFLWSYPPGQSPDSTARNAVAQPSPADPTSPQQVALQKKSTETPTNTRAAPNVVVVGAGISGITAALELGLGGARVTVLDMSSVYGGHAVMSQGGLCIVNSPLQQSLGIKDSPDLAYNDFITWGEDADEDWVRYYVNQSRSQIYDWLVELGVRFQGVETAPGNSVNRFHQPAGRGIGLVTPIYRKCLELENIQFRWNTQAVRLIVKSGRVTGVVGRQLRDGVETPFEASSVVLATGGFQSNLDMVREFWPKEFRFPERILAGSGRHSVGLGHRLATEVGAELAKMDHQWNYFTGIPDPRYPGTNRGLSAANMWGIIVNSQGQRFANLHQWAKEVMPALLAQPVAKLWFVFDEPSKPHFLVYGSDWADFSKVEKQILNNPDLVRTANTLEELAVVTGLPAATLTATVTRYNTLVERGVDTDFGRFSPQQPEIVAMSPALKVPPFYAMPAFPLTRKSMGGVAIDLACRVLDRQQAPIPGLYAVGELTGLAGINGKAALEGTFLGPCILTGRVAARAILAQLPAAQRTFLKAETTRCDECHQMTELLSEKRKGFWHFQQVHQRTVELAQDCRDCHAELTPYQERHHLVDHQVLASTCAQCHLGRE